jgi:hypothetical protein
LFCSQCGKKIVRNDGHTVPPIDSIASSVDLKKSTGKCISCDFLAEKLRYKKCLYGVIISAVLIIIFGSMTVSAINPAKEVKAEVTYASEPYTEYSSGNWYDDTYYQRLDVVYKNKECSGVKKLGLYNPYGSTVDVSYHVGSKVTAYVVNGKLLLDKGSVNMNPIKMLFSSILLLGSIGSCGYFGLQYLNNKKRG